MSSFIRIYLFPDTSKYLIADNSKIINNISQDTHTIIKYVNKKFDSFFTIEGKFEDVHQARIIMQDIEKNLYREVYLEQNHESGE